MMSQSNSILKDMQSFWKHVDGFFNRIMDKNYGKRKISILWGDRILHGYVEEERPKHFVCHLDDEGYIKIWRWQVPIRMTHVVIVEKDDPDIERVSRPVYR